jgi:hypothetical protein
VHSHWEKLVGSVSKVNNCFHIEMSVELKFEQIKKGIQTGKFLISLLHNQHYKFFNAHNIMHTIYAILST